MASPSYQSYAVLGEFATNWRLLATKAMRFYINLQHNYAFIAIHSHQSYTVLCKFTTKSRFLATKAIWFYVSLRQNHEFLAIAIHQTKIAIWLGELARRGPETLYFYVFSVLRLD